MNLNPTEFTEKIINWYKSSGRDLPWRKTNDPYCIWISEIMLQQTQVETVKPYYERFIQTFPTALSLAEAPLETVYKLWEGLGYYRRAAHLKEAAQMIRDRFNGRFPNTYTDILSLKGVGSYTASAISSIAFLIPKGVIDGNTLRIISRVLNRQDNIAQEKTKKTYQQIMDQWIVWGNPSDFNQGMMDLGAMICTPKNPSCDQCPVSGLCEGFRQKKQHILPVNIKNRSKTETYYITALIRCKDRYFMVKNEDGLLVNLYGLPQFEVESPLSFEEAFYDTYGTQVRLLEYEKEFKHVFTHKVWHMSLYLGELIGDPKPALEHLYTFEQLSQVPIPTAHKKVLDAAFRA